MTVHKVAIVAGATRGAGRGIARALGEAGFIVACTGRSLRGAPSPYGMPELIPGAVALRVDHTREEEVAALFARVERDHGPVEVVADKDPALGPWSGMVDTDLASAELALRQGLVARAITAKHAALAMRPRGRGLIVEVTEGDLPLGAGGNLISALVKAGVKALAALLAEELRGSGVAAVSITPGFLRSEAMLRHFGVTRDTWREAGAKDPHFLHSESPLLVGRAVAALAADPDVLARTGSILSSWELAREYGFTDEDGARPDWGAHWRTGVVPAMPELRRGIEHQAAWLEVLARRAREQLAG
jgi:NAD(P)-dependent dehydrogenase (short-subunit alcohol dehydrogenase family)